MGDSARHSARMKLEHFKTKYKLLFFAPGILSKALGKNDLLAAISIQNIDTSCQNFNLEEWITCGKKCQEDFFACSRNCAFFDFQCVIKCTKEYQMCLNGCPCTAVTEFEMSEGACTGKWSAWDDRDNPSGTGDWELLSDRHDFPSLCETPMAAQARIISTGSMVTDQHVTFGLNGLSCKNSDQPHGNCYDYEVRVCCKPDITLQEGECTTGQWSAWDDRDDPTATGDWELIHDRADYESLCKVPEAVEARVVGTGAMNTHQNVNFGLNGLSCKNEDQNNEMCLDYEVRVCCPGEVPLKLGECTDNGSWSSWFDHDNPSGTGDWELLQDRRDACAAPVAIEGRLVGSHATTTTEDISITLTAPNIGLVCQNENQGDGSCLDYEVRFCCIKKVTSLEVGTCTGQWSSWDDRDNPSGTGDWEQIQFRHDADSLCENPSAVQARVVEKGALETTQNVQLDLNGFVCQNNDQFGEMCWDYEVRVCCEEQVDETSLVVGECKFGTWTSWFDRDNPSGTGDWELLKDQGGVCERPTAVEARIIGSTAMTTTEVVTISLAGFVCQNVNQADRYCEDYEIRYCCGDDKATELTTGTCEGGKWSSWYDRDNPGGVGDWERIIDHGGHEKLDDVCEFPAAAEARVVGTTNLDTTEVVDFTNQGLVCQNHLQADGRCNDYEVRWCCKPEETILSVGECDGPWSRWYNRDHWSGVGDFERLYDHHYHNNVLSDVPCDEPAAAEARIRGSGAMTTDEIVNFGTHGLSCENADQVDGRCEDYEVRWCCGGGGNHPEEPIPDQPRPTASMSTSTALPSNVSDWFDDTDEVTDQ